MLASRGAGGSRPAGMPPLRQTTFSFNINSQSVAGSSLRPQRERNTAAQEESAEEESGSDDAESEELSRVPQTEQLLGGEGASSAAEHGVPLAGIERKRKFKFKKPAGPRGRCKSGRTTRETKVVIAKRLQQFPNQGLVIAAGKLFCKPCREVQPNLKESLRRHLSTAKHQAALAHFLQASEAEQQTHSSLSEFFERHQDISGVRRCVIVSSCSC